MDIKELVENDSFEDVLLEIFIPKEFSRPRVRPVFELPRNILVEFPMNLRIENPIGTRFTSNVKVCQKKNKDGSPIGQKYLCADKKSILIVSEHTPLRKIYAVKKLGTVSDRSFEYKNS
jgi:hypothetical protein